jgi:hypothetical protein
MLQSRGLRLALAGFVLLLLGAATLLISKLAAVVLMLTGGMAVWSGFIWTLFQYYVPPQPPDQG